MPGHGGAYRGPPMNQGLRAVPSVVTSIARVIVPIIVRLIALLPGSFSGAIFYTISRVRVLYPVPTWGSISGTTGSID